MPPDDSFHPTAEHKQVETNSQAFLDDMKALQRIYLELSKIDDLETLYQQMVRLSQQWLGLDRLALFRVIPETNELIGTYGVDPTGAVRDEHYYQEAITADHWSLGIVNSPNHARYWETGDLLDSGRSIGTGWKAAATLWDGHQAIGYLVTDNFISHRAARAYEAEFASLLGSTYGHLIRMKESAEALRQSEASYRQLFNQIDDAIFIHDTAATILDVNEAACRRLGYSREELLRMKTHDLDVPNYGRGFDERLRHQIKEGRLSNIETIHRRRDGSLIYIDVNSTVITYQGKTAVLAVCRDISESKKSEIALLESENKLRLFIDQSPNGLLITDETGHITEWNAAQERLTGMSRSAVVGRLVADVQFQLTSPENRRPETYNHLRQRHEHLNKTGVLPPGTAAIETQIVSVDGTLHYVYSMSSAIRTAKGFILATNFFDITERRQMEELLRLQRDLSLSLAVTRDPVAAAQQVLIAVCQVQGIDSGGFYTVDSETGTVDLIAHHKLSPLFIENTSHYPADSPNAQVVRARQVLYAEYPDLRAQNKAYIDQEGLRALAMIPIQHEGQSIALLNLASHTYDSIPANARLALESIAIQVSSTLARIHAEYSLGESEERYRSLFEKNTAVKIIIDTDTTAIVEVNNAALNFYGYSREQFKSIHLHDLNMLPDETILADMDLVRNEQRSLFVRKHRLADGEIRDVQVFSGPVDIRGKSYLHSIIIDITAQHQAEEALRENEERLRLIMENSQEGILLMNEQTQVIMANPAACRIYGRSEAELLASRQSDLLDETDIRFRHFIEEVNRTGRGQSELTGFRPDRASFPLEISVGVFTSRDGRQLRSGTARDISERQRYQQTLIEQEKLRTALAKETELSQLKTRMMERIAHEFRTPLAVIHASAESLDVYMDRLTGEQKAKKFSNIYERVHHITDFLQQISFIINEQLMPDKAHLRRTDLSALCRQTTLELETQLEQPGRYTLDLPELVMVRADSTALKNAVFHVMRNAAQFSAPTSAVNVSLSPRDQGIELVVSDSGIGILPEDQGRIFEAFFRGANIDMVGGLGLGLTIAKACVELHRGTIQVESIPAQGTTVRLWLPLAAS